MKQAKYILDKDYIIGEVDRRLFGSFIEHLGRVVYGGIYEPGHPNADEQGFRRDVIELVKELNVSIIRYPGGNFVSGYNWKDGIGPIEFRPKRLELAWKAIETNEFGIDEFVDWAKKAGVEVMMVVNLGTGTPKEAAELVEYCNHQSDSYWSNLRKKYGHGTPYGIKLWGLGNEMDGPWQICHLDSEDYGKKALETAKMMKWVDSSIELVVCGSSAPEVPSYCDWNRIVLEYTYDKVDYISIHRYYTYDPKFQPFYPTTDDITDIAYFPIDLDNYIHNIVSTVDFVKAKINSKRKINISLDEWGIISNFDVTKLESWYTSIDSGESTSNLIDALIYGGLLCTILRNCDRIKIACQALLVNLGGMISAQKRGLAIRNTIFYPFQQVATYGKGQVLMQQIACPTIKTNHYGEVSSIQSASVYNSEDNSLTIFMVNYNQDDDIEVLMDFRSFRNVKLIEHSVIKEDNMFAMNTYSEPNKVIPKKLNLNSFSGSIMHIVLPKLSWNMLRLNCNSE
ncbi:MAG: alpha-N-arabinofuranosidase [Firmicutes bacterium]|nr:alpha-N-arabinofuranosidase [Bacillota bacterium]